MLDDILLGKFIKGFFGYGNLNASDWFIGMEEGGGDNNPQLALPEIASRLQVWQEMGEKKVICLCDFHNKVAERIADDGRLQNKAAVNRWFKNKSNNRDSPIQSTWGALIKIQLAVNGKNDIALKDIRKIQQSDFGLLTSGQCLLELLPLPKPGLAAWPYKDISSIDFLKEIDSYRKKIIDDRVSGIRDLINGRTTKPKNVFFYGVGYAKHWEKVADRSFSKENYLGVPIAHTFDGTTHYYVVRHPAARNGRCYFDTVGKFARQNLG
jgi:hypothetical protein